MFSALRLIYDFYKTGEIVSKNEDMVCSTKGDLAKKEMRISDDTGSVKLVLWNSKVLKVMFSND